MSSRAERDASPVDPYRVRKVTSGYSGQSSYVVVLLRRGQRPARVSVHAAATRDSAQSAADNLNVLHRTPDHAEDPRSFDVRRAEAAAAYSAAITAKAGQ